MPWQAVITMARLKLPRRYLGELDGLLPAFRQRIGTL